MQCLPSPKPVEVSQSSNDVNRKHWHKNFKSIESEALVVELGPSIVKLWVFELNCSISLNLARDYVCKYFLKETSIKVPNNFVSSESELIQGVSPSLNITYVKVPTENLQIHRDYSSWKKSR